MSSIQRRRGQWCKVWPEKLMTDRRGDKVLRVDVTDKPYLIRAALVPSRGSRAEVPGQQEVDVYSMIFQTNLDDVGLFSRVFWREHYWDVVNPPAYHHGTRATRHWSMNVRRRPEQPAP